MSDMSIDTTGELLRRAAYQLFQSRTHGDGVAWDDAPASTRARYLSEATDFREAGLLADSAFVLEEIKAAIRALAEDRPPTAASMSALQILGRLAAPGVIS